MSVVAGIEKSYASKGYITIVRRKFLSHKPKHFVVKAFYAVFQKISDSKKVYEEVGGKNINNFLRKCLSHSVEKCRRGIL